MGRTHRKRSRRRKRSFYTCDHVDDHILLNTWLAEQGLCRNEKLVLASFDNTGRGVLTKKKIFPGEELMNMPLNLTINVTTILMDKQFNNIFIENYLNCIDKYSHTVSFQSLLAFYLVFLKHIDSKSKWCVYLKSLPTDYTVPYFLPHHIKCYLSADLLSIVTKQKDIVDTSFQIFKEILSHTKSCETTVLNFREYFTLPNYEWAYFTVNTRCVYMDLTNVVDLNSTSSLLCIVNDNTKIALCPYLDMINHDPRAKNETRLIVSKSSENIISIENLNDNIFSEMHFSIYTKNTFEPFTQVFICYGDSYNFKLLTEYGFIIPSNDLDYVSFDFDVLLSYLKSKGIALSHDQLRFINSHGLNKDLYIDVKGLSFNYYALLMVVKYYYKENIDVSKVIYMSSDMSDSSSLNEIIAPFVSEKVDKIKKCIVDLENFGKESVTLNNCVELMCHYVSILEKFKNKC